MKKQHFPIPNALCSSAYAMNNLVNLLFFYTILNIALINSKDGRIFQYNQLLSGCKILTGTKTEYKRVLLQKFDNILIIVLLREFSLEGPFLKVKLLEQQTLV